MVREKERIIITGGHVTPALALIDELEKGTDWEIFFVGRKFAMEGEKQLSFEYKQIVERKIPFLSITSGRLQRSITRYTLLSLAKIPLGIVQSYRILLRTKPHIIVSFGGYIALPIALSGWSLGIPIVTHEQTTIPGLANRIIAFLAKKICISWPETQKYFIHNKVILTGNLLRSQMLKKDSTPVLHTYKRDILYISGGSLGSHRINSLIAEILEELLQKFYIVHQCGESSLTHDYDFLVSKKNSLPKKVSAYYIVRPHFLAEEVAWLFSYSKLVVSRSGANTISELAYMEKPALLLPLPHAGASEQYANAQRLVSIGMAELIEDDKLTAESLFKTIIYMIQRIHTYEKNAHQAKSWINPHAAQDMVSILQSTFNKTA